MYHDCAYNGLLLMEWKMLLMTFIIRDIFQRDVRFRLVVHIIQDKLKTDYQSCAFSQTPDKLMDTFRVCNSLLDELYTEKDPKKKIVLDEFDEMQEYYNNILLPLWKKLRIELEKYAVINLPT